MTVSLDLSISGFLITLRRTKMSDFPDRFDDISYLRHPEFYSDDEYIEEEEEDECERD